MKLIEVLHIASAHEFKIKNTKTNKVIWKGSKSDNGYEQMLENYQVADVVGIKARSDGWGRSSIKSILVVEI